MADSDEEINDSSPWIITGKDMDRYFELHAALLEFSRLFDYEEPNDRAIVIVGAAFLDILLEHILIAFLVDDEKEVERLLRYDQPLGTYSSRITMAYCLGLINKVICDDLRFIGKIRNKFAHSLHISFEDQQIDSWCKELKWHRVAYVANPPSNASARNLFQVGVNQVITHLNGIVGLTRRDKRVVPRFS